ncbi:FmdB family zinc ribbon protein [Desulfosporosinus fructosivorans]
MPNYDFQCQKCSQKFSVFCSISQKDHQGCPYCGSEQLIQRITSVNIGGKSFAQDKGSLGASKAPRRGYG